MKTINYTENKSITAENTTIIGIDIAAYMINATANTAFTADMINTQNINCSLMLSREGKNYTIFDDNLKNLWIRSSYMKMQYRAFAGSQDLIGRVLLAAAASVYEIMLIPITLMLPGPINLKKNDKLVFQINFASGSLASTVNTTTSYLQVDFMEGIGIEYGVPFIRQESIQASESSYSNYLGDNINEIYVINYDKKSYLTTNRVVTQLTMTTDKFSRIDSDLEVILKDTLCNFIPGTTFEPYQNHIIYCNEVALNKANIGLTLNSANVTASNNWVIWAGINKTRESIIRGVNLYNEVKARELNSF